MNSPSFFCVVFCVSLYNFEINFKAKAVAVLCLYMERNTFDFFPVRFVLNNKTYNLIVAKKCNSRIIYTFLHICRSCAARAQNHELACTQNGFCNSWGTRVRYLHELSYQWTCGWAATFTLQLYISANQNIIIVFTACRRLTLLQVYS